MDKKTKLIALYLPQYHRIPENDEFWGEGFTDWVTVRNAKPLFKGHEQPHVPLNENYYDLSIEQNVLWQTHLAQQYGIYGFGVYHYWFNNEKNLLTKPVEFMRDAKNLGVKYFYIWDNGSWKRSWSNVAGNDWAPLLDASNQKSNEPIWLIKYELGKPDDWKNHYEYVKKHFQSENYEKWNNKPVFGIVNYNEDIRKMCNCWNEWAIQDGYEGIVFVFKHDNQIPNEYYRYSYEPHHTAWPIRSIWARILNRSCKILGIENRWKQKQITSYDYTKIWKKLVKEARECEDSNMILGAFTSYDDTPRRGRNKARLFKGTNVAVFKKYFQKLYAIANKRQSEYLFITAWNEWGEGAYLEPDTRYECQYLEAIKNIVESQK